MNLTPSSHPSPPVYVFSVAGTSRCDVRAACSGATSSNARIPMHARKRKEALPERKIFLAWLETGASDRSLKHVRRRGGRAKRNRTQERKLNNEKDLESIFQPAGGGHPWRCDFCSHQRVVIEQWRARCSSSENQRSIRAPVARGENHHQFRARHQKGGSQRREHLQHQNGAGKSAVDAFLR